jgi:hypothetical protein
MAAALVQGQEFFEALIPRNRGNGLLAARFHAEGKPLLRISAGVFHSV